MKTNLSSFAVLLKEIGKAKDFDEFNDFVFNLFKWLGAKSVYMKVEEFNHKYFKTYINNSNTRVKDRVKREAEEYFFKKNFLDYNRVKETHFRLENPKTKLGIMNIDVIWFDENNNSEIVDEMELLTPVLILKMEQLHLSQSVNKYEEILENSMDIIMLIEQNELEYVSPQVKDFTGFDLRKFSQNMLTETLLSKKNQKDIASKIKEDERLQRPFSKREYPILDSKGNPKWIEWVVRRIFDDHGDITRMILNFRDISDKKKAQEELSKQRKFLQDILDKLPVEIFLKDLHGRFIFINDLAARNQNLDKESISGKLELDTLDKVKAKEYALEDQRVINGEVLSDIIEIKKEGRLEYYLSKKQLVEFGDQKLILVYSVDITEQKMIEERLRDSTNFINRSIQIIPDSIFVFDLLKFDYAFTNNKLFKQLGYSDYQGDTDLRTFIREIIHPEDVEAYFNQLDEIKKGKEDIYELEYKVFDKNKGIKWLFSRKAPFKRNDKTNAVEQFVGITYDITEQKTRESNLLDTQLELKSALTSREEFLSVISHEIRTPLNAIVGIATLLNQPENKNDQEEMLRVLKNSGDNLLLMINDILDFSKIKAGQMQFDISGFEIRSLMKNMCNTYQPQIIDKGLGMKCEIDPRIPEYLEGDAMRLNQILNNLISNALKFTSKGEINLSAEFKEINKETVEISFIIADTGIGIEKSKQEIIFDPFKQVSANTSRKYGGTGLGLAITKELLEKQGGELQVFSKPNKGSKFIAKLKFNRVTKSLLGSQYNLENDFQYNDFKIPYKLLYIEDVASNRYLMKAYCKQWNLELILAESGNEALEILKSENFDIILMDIHMPVLDGFETMARIQKEISDIPPVIALSADVSQKVAEKIRVSGMIDYVSKPIQIDVLYNTLRKYLEPNELEKIVKKKHLKSVEKSPIQKIKDIYGENENDFKEYLHSSQKEIKSNIQELITSIEEQNIEAFIEVRHKFIGIAGIFELKSLTEILDKVKGKFHEYGDKEKLNLVKKDIKQILEKSLKSIIPKA